MMPTPKHLPILTMGLLLGGMGIFIKFKKSHDVRTEADAKIAAETVREVKLPSAGRKSSMEQSSKESATPPKSNDEGE